jgi:HEAT repeat protein
MPGAEAIELTHDETALIEESVKTAGVAATIENMPVLLDLLHLEDDDLRYRSVLDALEAIRNEALKEKNLDAALKVVAGYAREKERRGLDAKETELIRRALERASAQETIMQLVDMSLHLDKSSPEYALILGYLHTLSDRTYYVLLERLEEESSKSLRLAIRGLLIALGKVNMSTLSARVLHKQWFVARNVVSILGEIGGESAVEVLAAALRHEEPRVRREALNALGKIGGERSAQIIATALEDRDDQVRLCAARWLTTVGDSAPVEALVAIVKSSRFRRMDLETVLLAVRSIAQRDGIVPAQFLEQIARKRITALFGSGKQIAAGAAAALRAKAN